jgi:hypothetical protein
MKKEKEKKRIRQGGTKKERNKEKHVKHWKKERECPRKDYRKKNLMAEKHSFMYSSTCKVRRI